MTLKLFEATAVRRCAAVRFVFCDISKEDLPIFICRLETTFFSSVFGGLPMAYSL
jgi:hypothetical protein